MPIPLLAAAAVPSLVKGVAGVFDIFGGKKRARRNVRPTAQVNENFQKNVALAESMGRTGLPQEQYNRAAQNIARNQSRAFSSLGRSANPSAGINSLLRASNDATLGLDVQDANARLNNQRFAFGQRSQLANEQNRVWDWNNRQRYQEEANAAAQQIGSGKQNAFGALTDLSMLGQAYLGAEAGQSPRVGDATNQFAGSPGYIKNYLPSAQLSPTSSGSNPISMNKYYTRFKF